MFYCEPCRVEYDWPSNVLGPNSRGSCEMCGKTADCHDVPSQHLTYPKVRQVPEGVRRATITAWGRGLKEGRHHAAKQLACFMGRIGVGNTDDNFVCDATLSLGMAAEVQPNAEHLIRWFEEQVLKKWFGSGDGGKG